MIKIKTEENFLIPIFDIRKSFYNKAYTKEHIKIFMNSENKIIKQKVFKIELYSYNTLVLTLTYNDIDGVDDDYFYKYTLNNKIDKKLLFSNTTLRHMKEFIKQKEILKFLDNITKKDIIENNNKIYTYKYKKL